MRFLSTGAPTNIQGALLRALDVSGELSIPALRALSPLSDKAQVLIDKAVVDVGLQRLSFVADLMSEGLTYTLTDPLSVTQLEWETVSQTGGAQRTMSPSARGEFQMPNRAFSRLPIYLTTDDFSLGIRTLKMSQRVGQPLDTSLVAQATRRVNESIEDAAINGATTATGEAFNVGGYGAPGLLNAPNANTYSLGTSWATATGEQVRVNVMAMIDKLQVDKKFGPYNLYVGTSYSNALDADFKANGNLSVRQRLEQIEAGGRNLRIRNADYMPANTAVLVQMTSDVVEVVNGQEPTVIPWTSPDGFTLFWIVLAIIVPRVRSDYDGNSGIVVSTV